MFETWTLQEWIIIGGLIVNVIMHFVHKFNDLRHVQSNQKEIMSQLKSINQRLDNQGERIAKIEGRLNGR